MIDKTIGERIKQTLYEKRMTGRSEEHTYENHKNGR